MTRPFDPGEAAQRLLQARERHVCVPSALICPPDRAAAFAVQDLTAQALGDVRAWKVGAKGPHLEPGAAPLPASGLLAAGVQLSGPRWVMRGVEVEVAVRLGRDLPASADLGDDELCKAIACVLPAIEIVETRLIDWRESDPLAQLADLQSHGALVLGAPSSMDPADVDLRQVQAYLAFDGQPVASARGANPAADLRRLLRWLAVHAAQRGRPLRAGDVITTGSCTGMLFAGEGMEVLADLSGIGSVTLRF